MEQSLQLVVVFLAALASGGLMVNWIGLGRAMSRLSASTYVEFHQATNHTFDPYMPIVVVGALLGGIVLAILSPGIPSISGELAIAGSVVGYPRHPQNHSHSMVLGGFEVTSYTTRLIPLTSLTIRLAARAKKPMSKR